MWEAGGDLFPALLPQLPQRAVDLAAAPAGGQYAAVVLAPGRADHMRSPS
jgi:hypothetical protein